jgi:alkylhydroperoxidase/carboxymuconolactone decarboxylase family protein YurZ
VKPSPTTTADDDLDRLLGYRLPELDWLREQAPEYDAIRRRLLRVVFAPEHPTFPVRYREIVAGIVAATRSTPTVEVHFRRALREGATLEEIVEAVQIAERPGGATMLHFALGALARISPAHGSTDDRPASGERSGAAPVATAPAGANVDSKRGYAFPAFEVLRKLDPEYDDARRALIAWIYTPDQSVLPVKYHEVLSGVVLSSRFYPSAESHFRRALGEGVSMLELIEALQAAAVPGGGPTLHYGLTILSRIAEEQAGGDPAEDRAQESQAGG